MGELLDSSRLSPHRDRRVQQAGQVVPLRPRQFGGRVGDRQRGQRQLDGPVLHRRRPSSPRPTTTSPPAGKRTALTLYYNVGCGDGPKELDPIAFSQKYVPAAVRDGLDYVLLSYYEDDCNGIRPTCGDLDGVFRPAPQPVSPRPARVRGDRHGHARDQLRRWARPVAHGLLLRARHQSPVLRRRLLLVVLRRRLPALHHQATVVRRSKRHSPRRPARARRDIDH